MVRNSNSIRVLIVDDELLVADTLVMIAEAEGYTARAAYNAEEAADIADEFRPHACVSDVMMPGMNGLEFAEWMADHHPDCKLLLISGHADLLDNLTLNGRRRTVLPKPMQPVEFLRFLATCHAASTDTAQRS
jgi:CheY-like chemotaxis protein